VKVIPQNIYDLLTPAGLAHFIMGDGTREPGYGVILCTDSYTILDVVRLMNVLMIKYRLECTLRYTFFFLLIIKKKLKDNREFIFANVLCLSYGLS
jgi:hypothetical protein